MWATCPRLRFHPTCFYRAQEGAPRETWPALLAAVTDPGGAITGVLRTWLARDGSAKAPLATPRRSLGRLLGSGARFGKATDVLAAGEGLQTMLSLRVVLPALPVVAALSATHLAAFVPPSGLRRLYIARDNDRVGHRAAEMLGARAHAEGIEAVVLTPQSDDFNTDLTTGAEALAASLRVQLAPDDAARFLTVDQRPGPRPRLRGPASGPSSPSRWRRCRKRLSPATKRTPAAQIRPVAGAAGRHGCGTGLGNDARADQRGALRPSLRGALVPWLR
jgi:hypothetical protein